MRAFHITATADTPLVSLEPGGQMSFSGRSLPEDATAFYEPVFSWLMNYSGAPATESVFVFDLEYFNTASAKQLFKLLLLIKDLSSRSRTSVTWLYDDGDTDMRNSGERFSKLTGIALDIQVKKAEGSA